MLLQRTGDVQLRFRIVGLGNHLDAACLARLTAHLRKVLVIHVDQRAGRHRLDHAHDLPRLLPSIEDQHQRLSHLQIALLGPEVVVDNDLMGVAGPQPASGDQLWPQHLAPRRRGNDEDTPAFDPIGAQPIDVLRAPAFHAHDAGHLPGTLLQTFDPVGPQKLHLHIELPVLLRLGQGGIQRAAHAHHRHKDTAGHD